MTNKTALHPGRISPPRMEFGSKRLKLEKFALQTFQVIKQVFARPRYHISIVKKKIQPGSIVVKFLCYECDFILDINYAYRNDLNINIYGDKFRRQLILNPTSPQKIRQWTVFLCKDLILAGVKSLMES